MILRDTAREILGTVNFGHLLGSRNRLGAHDDPYLGLRFTLCSRLRSDVRAQYLRVRLCPACDGSTESVDRGEEELSTGLKLRIRRLGGRTHQVDQRRALYHDLGVPRHANPHELVAHLVAKMAEVPALQEDADVTR